MYYCSFSSMFMDCLIPGLQTNQYFLSPSSLFPRVRRLGEAPLFSGAFWDPRDGSITKPRSVHQPRLSPHLPFPRRCHRSRLPPIRTSLDPREIGVAKRGAPRRERISPRERPYQSPLIRQDAHGLRPEILKQVLFLLRGQLGRQVPHQEGSVAPRRGQRSGARASSGRGQRLLGGRHRPRRRKDRDAERSTAAKHKLGAMCKFSASREGFW